MVFFPMSPPTNDKSQIFVQFNLSTTLQNMELVLIFCNQSGSNCWQLESRVEKAGTNELTLPSYDTDRPVGFRRCLSFLFSRPSSAVFLRTHTSLVFITYGLVTQNVAVAFVEITPQCIGVSDSDGFFRGSVQYLVNSMRKMSTFHEKIHRNWTQLLKNFFGKGISVLISISFVNRINRACLTSSMILFILTGCANFVILKSHFISEKFTALL